MPQRATDWVADAQWVWLKDYSELDKEAKFVNFRKEFHLDSKPVDPVLIKVSADTRYRLFINDRSVSFGPCKSYTATWSFETVDISPHCVPGKNVLAARVLRYSPFWPGNSSFMRAKTPGFLVHGSVSVT